MPRGLLKQIYKGKSGGELLFNDVIEINKEPIIDAYTLNGAREENKVY